MFRKIVHRVYLENAARSAKHGPIETLIHGIVSEAKDRTTSRNHKRTHDHVCFAYYRDRGWRRGVAESAVAHIDIVVCRIVRHSVRICSYRDSSGDGVGRSIDYRDTVRAMVCDIHEVV